MIAPKPSSFAIRATARPWLPSVAQASVIGRSDAARFASSSSVDRSSAVIPSRCWTAFTTAHDAPRILNAGNPIRLDSSFSQSRSSPNSRAIAGNSISGDG